MKNTLPSELTRVALLLFEGLGSPMAQSASAMVRASDWEGISQLYADPRRYPDALSYFRDTAAASLLKKLAELPSGVDKRAAALQKWWAGERDCFRSNERLSRYLGCFSKAADRDETVSLLLDDIRKIILSWIGRRPPELVRGRHGPGATYSDRGAATTVAHKMSSVPSITRDAVWFLPQWLGTHWGTYVSRRHGELSYVRGNRFATVPKTSLTDRSIASEPSINMFYQLGLGGSLRRRLKRSTGWDLDTAPDIHRKVAMASSTSFEFATLDLSNASDTVCSNLVRLLLPPEWFHQLDDLRSKRTQVDGHWVHLEKFSSMGNGFTFELETLIFASVACVVSQRCGFAGKLGFDVFVFGDDIIVKDEVVASLKPVLQFLGFTLNDSKSFWGKVPFRESCGADFFNGIAVRPYYLKDVPCGPADFVAFANGVRALIERLTLAGADRDMRAWLCILDQLPTRVRSCRGPSALGDIVIHDDEEHWRFREEYSIRHFRALVPDRTRKVGWGLFAPEVVLACAVYGTGGGIDGGLTPRDAVLSYKIAWVPPLFRP